MPFKSLSRHSVSLNHKTQSLSSSKDRAITLQSSFHNDLLHRNNKVSLAEIDKMVTSDKFWQICNHKPALMRAYKYATSRAGGGDGDAYIERKEFKALLSNLFYFNKLFLVFDAIDSGSDRRCVPRS